MEFATAVHMLSDASLQDEADQVDREIVGRNVFNGRWTFQIVDEFDDLYYYDVVRACLLRQVKEYLGGDRHALKRRMKAAERTPGSSAHAPTPQQNGEPLTTKSPAFDGFG